MPSRHGVGLFAFWDWFGAEKDTRLSIGSILAFLVLVAAFVLFLMGKMDGVTAGMFGALALAILLSAFPIRWSAPA